ncbi:MAG: hypothetical protein ACRC2T_12720 [Thermoguttaceae bacterium]
MIKRIHEICTKIHSEYNQTRIKAIQSLSDYFRVRQISERDNVETTLCANTLLDIIPTETDESVLDEIIDALFLITEGAYVKANWLNLARKPLKYHYADENDQTSRWEYDLAGNRLRQMIFTPF